ncbi:MAG: hypothetical protein HRT89_09475 [Lentisphaeria bacterium]|nr:hypothetical protein [Lentisphaeria bacterium]NQZ68290.1 hypothetical protein [Lentisphaeria bacterium]
MDLSKFTDLSDDARAWVYIFEKPLSEEDLDSVEDKLTRFMESWNCHGASVRGAWHCFENKILIIAGESTDGMSGCSIDSSVRVLKELKTEGIDALNIANVHYRTADEILTIGRTAFANLCNSGSITDETIVFDISSVTRVGQLRETGIEKEFRSSWHAQAF